MGSNRWTTAPVTITIPPSIEHQIVISCIRALTIVTLSPIVLQRRTLQDRFADLNVCIICILLHALHYTIPSFSLAVAYSTWNFLPDSLTNVSELPSHAKFMKDLDVIQLPPSEANPDQTGQNKSEDCMICWDSQYPLAKLPCTHLACTQCLGLMSSLFQTACPMCRRPLFTHNDRFVMILSKGAASLLMVNAMGAFVGFTADIYLRKYRLAVITLGIGAMYGGLWYMYFHMISARGKNWWRIGPAKKDLGMLVLNLCMQLFALLSSMVFWEIRFDSQ